MPLNAVFSAPQFGGPKYKALTDFNYASVVGFGKAFPGMVFSAFGNLYQVVQNRSGGALAAGDAVSLYFGNANRTGNLATGTTAAVLLTDDTLDSNVAGEAPNQECPAWACITAGVLATTADMQRRRILANSIAAGASTITVAVPDASKGPTEGTALNSSEIFTGTLDNTYDYDVFAPWEVVKADFDALGTTIVQGIVVSTTITDQFFGIIQIEGIAIAKVDGTTDLVAGDLLIADSAAGVLSKWVVTTTDPTTAQVNQSNYVCGRILNAYTNNGVGLRQIQLFRRNAYIPYPIF